MPISIKKEILRTIIYGDIFDYPLKKNELWRFLISEYKINFESFNKYLINSLPKKVSCSNNFYFLTGRENLVRKRIEREKESRAKKIIAKNILKKVSYIPTIQLIGISGGLSLNNADTDDDIDIFVVTSKNRVWFTRICMVLLLKIMKSYRKRNDKNVSNKICLNMIIDETLLDFSKKRMDLYTAHEIIQIAPIFERNNSYKKFLNSNKWIYNFLPNTKTKKNKILRHENIAGLLLYNNILTKIVINDIIETFAKHFQLWFIKRHKTSEIANDHLIAFHPFDYRSIVLNKYNKMIKRYEV